MATDIKGKIVKKRKQAGEFDANIVIDNIAPVDKILEDLEIKNYEAYSFYCRTIRQRLANKENYWSYHYSLPGHPLNAFSDNWDGDLNPGYFEEFPYKSLLPKMISKLNNIGKQDPVTKYMKMLSDWNRDCHNLKISTVLGNKLPQYESLNEEVIRCPKHFVDLAALLDSDPDPYFDSTYNWYYAGNGNLQLICIDGVDYLLHSEFNVLYLSRFSKDELSVADIDHSATYNCGEGNNILESISSANIIALRTKKKVFILKVVNSDDKLEIEKTKAMESELPFTSISFDSHHKNIIYVTSLDNKLTIVNIDRMKGRSVMLKTKLNSLVNNWNMVGSSDRVTYTHVAGSCITIYDKRTNKPSHTWNHVRDITDDYGCNDITSAKHREGRPSLYFSTDHHLFHMDLRCYNKPKVVQRWNHGMQCAPTLISICNFEFNKEIICLNSQWCEDTCVVTNYSDTLPKDTEISGVTMPFRPPSILNTLNEARQKLLCFDMYSPIDSRLCTAVTGSMIFEHGENYIILMQNSLGDITYHNLYPEHLETFIDDDSTQQLHEWCKSHQKKTKDLEVSSIEDFSQVWKRLKKVPDSHKIGEGRLMDENNEKFSKNEVFDAFKNQEELDDGLLEIWTKSHNETAAVDKSATVEESSLLLNLRYSDSE